MTATILLVRHAAHDHLDAKLSGRIPGLPLSAAGRHQATALASALADRFDRIETSPVQRARETAAAIAQGALVSEVAALNEIDFGDWTGHDFAALAEDRAWREWNSHRGSARAPNGETMAAAQARAVAHVQAAGDDGGRIAMVSHSDIIRAVVAHYLGLSLDLILRFAVDAASITTLEVGQWGGRLLQLNEVPA